VQEKLSPRNLNSQGSSTSWPAPPLITTVPKLVEMFRPKSTIFLDFVFVHEASFWHVFIFVRAALWLWISFRGHFIHDDAKSVTQNSGRLTFILTTNNTLSPLQYVFNHWAVLTRAKLSWNYWKHHIENYWFILFSDMFLCDWLWLTTIMGL
jgi:hypothetical protein